MGSKGELDGYGLLVRRASRDTAKIENLLLTPRGSDCTHFAIQPLNQEFVFVERGFGALLRSNHDGTMTQILATNQPLGKGNSHRAITGTVAIDEVRSVVYWSGSFYEGTNPIGAIWKMKLPPRFKRQTLTAPPLIKTVTPHEFHAGESIAISGEHLEPIKALVFVDDATHKHVKAEFHPNDARSLSATVPKLSDSCKHPTIIVETLSGVTMTITRSVNAIREQQRYEHDRLKENGASTFWAKSGSDCYNIEHAIMIVEKDSTVGTGPRGCATLFIKNCGYVAFQPAGDCVVYHEPFAVIPNIYKYDAYGARHASPAIRASLMDTPITYQSESR